MKQYLDNLYRKAKRDHRKNYSLYGELSNLYDFMYGSDYDQEKQLDFCLEELGSEKPDRILDVGCGDGSLVKIASEEISNSFIKGIDLNEEMISTARSKIDSDNVMFEKSDIDEFNDEYNYDLVMCFGVTAHMDKELLRSFVKDSKRFLSEGGVLVFDYKDPNVDTSGRFNKYENKGHGYTVTGRWITTYDDSGQQYYAHSHELNPQDDRESVFVGGREKIYSYTTAELRDLLSDYTSFTETSVKEEKLEQHGVVTIKK